MLLSKPKEERIEDLCKLSFFPKKTLLFTLLQVTENIAFSREFFGIFQFIVTVYKTYNFLACLNWIITIDCDQMFFELFFCFSFYYYISNLKFGISKFLQKKIPSHQAQKWYTLFYFSHNFNFSHDLYIKLIHILSTVHKCI